MKIDGIDVTATIEDAKAKIDQEPNLSPALKATLDLLLLLVTLLLNRHTLNSKNSSTPPSADPNRKKDGKDGKDGTNNRKPGGQPGRNGTTLKPVDEPDAVTPLRVNRRSLPKDRSYRKVGVEKRQVFDIQIARVVTEYQAEVLEDSLGNRWVASFPEGVNRPVQYGNGLKAHAVYLSQYQMIPYERVREYFADQLGIPVSVGALVNFNRGASERLDGFAQWVTAHLRQQPLLHVDETGLNIGGQRQWLHVASTPSATWLTPHRKRGKLAMDEAGVLPFFHGVLCHDHWKPYYQYDCSHALCNAHHVRELQRAWEQDGQAWAKAMQTLLYALNTAVEAAGGQLAPAETQRWQRRYRRLLKDAEAECPPPEAQRQPGQRGRIKRSKARNLLERLRAFETDVLRFMTDANVPFTNNQGENDLRMSKVQQKISGCFRSTEGATTFSRVRSYVSTCRKRGMTAAEALTLLFQNENPEFMNSS